MAKKPSTDPPISEQLRRVIAADGRSLYLLAQLAGIDRGNLYRFARGDSGLGLDAIDRLAVVLGVRIATSRKVDT